MDWFRHRILCSRISTTNLPDVCARAFGYRYCRYLITLATIGLDVDTIRGFPEASALWTKHIQGKAYRVDLRMAREDLRHPYKCLDFIGSGPTDLAALDVLRPGVAESVTRQIQNRPPDAIPVALLIFDTSGIPINLTTMTFSFDITLAVPYPANTTAKDAEIQLQAHIDCRNK
jgi:hypothetical protein